MKKVETNVAEDATVTPEVVTEVTENEEVV